MSFQHMAALTASATRDTLSSGHVLNLIGRKFQAPNSTCTSMLQSDVLPSSCRSLNPTAALLEGIARGAAAGASDRGCCASAGEGVGFPVSLLHSHSSSAVPLLCASSDSARVPAASVGPVLA